MLLGTEPAAALGGAVLAALSRARQDNDGKAGKGGTMEQNRVRDRVGGVPRQ